MKRRAIERYDKFLKHVEKSAHILDAGCGTGRFISYFIRKGYKVTGIDGSKAMIDIAVRENPNVDLYVMDMRTLSFPDDQFDGIWNSGCILHLEEEGVKATFKESKRVLKRGGIFFISTRTGDEKLSTVEDSKEGGQIIVNYHTTEKLTELLKETGFEIIEMDVEKDDWGRPFEYCYVYAKSANFSV